MRVLVSILLCLLPLGQVRPPRDTAAAPSQPSGTLRGRAVASDTRAPIPWANVWIRDADIGTFSVSLHTDERGRFEARNLPPGDYRVTVMPPDNRTRYLTAVLPRPILVTADDRSEPIEVVLPLAAAIGGRVVDEAGEPLARVRIQLHRFDPEQGKTQPAQGVVNQTDDLGRFRAYGLEGGEYVISATSDESHVRSQDSPPAFVETFYPSTTNIEEATRIQIKPGQDFDGAEIRLLRTKTYRISGTIFAPDGQPAAHATASLHHIGGNGEELEVDGAGRFAAGGLTPGMYDVSVSLHSTVSMFGGVRFTVADADVTDLVVTTAPGVDIGGRLVVDQSKGVPPLDVDVEVTRIDPDHKVNWIPGRVPVNPDASFVMRGVFGATLIRVRRMPPGWTLKAVLLNGEDVTDKPVEFRMQDSGHLEIVLTRRASIVEGSVRDNRDRPVDDYAVVLFSSNRSDWIPDSSRTQLTYSRSDARFRFDGVRAGRYWMIAIPRELAGGGWIYSSAGFERFVKDATDVVVGDDDRRSVDLKLVTPRE